MVAADAVGLGNRGDEVAGIVRRISASDPRRDRVRSASIVFRPGPRAFSFELILMKPPSSGGCRPPASNAMASWPRPMMNGVDSRPALPKPRFRKKWRRDSDMESSF